MSPLTRSLASVQFETPEAQPEVQPEVQPEKEIPQPVRTIWGIPRRLFFVIATGVAVLVICGIVVGVVLGLAAKNKKTTTYPAITASGVFTGANNTEWHMHIVHTNMTTGAITVKSNNGTGSWSTEQNLTLSIVPAMDAPMSATSVVGGHGEVYLSLFYIDNHNIVLANISCVSTNCTTLSNDVISKGITFPLLAESALASVYVNSTMGYRVYYHNSDKYVTELSSTGDGLWDHGTTISGKALSGSSMCASLLGENGNINVIYVDDKEESLYNVQFDGRWQNPTAMLDSDPNHWNPLAAISSSYQSGSDTLSAYFTGSDKGIWQLTATNASSSEFAAIIRGDLKPDSTSGFSTAGWNQTARRDLSWAPSDAVGAQIASLAWDSQARLFRLIGGSLAESLQINGVWSADFV